uniref:Endonuclease/exonuclease/phosphatase domain-containing protein n=1 Tax=Lactuca sativa TaxID=4236 RepID=A0A9R1UX54_LACSA|nr:hypothetical protein LSAT_V11C800442710 [Lactuca sativa]
MGDCIVIGDFNIVRDDTKRLGSHYHPTVAINFNDFIDFRDTNDVPMGVLILLGVTSRGLNLVNLIDFWSPREHCVDDDPTTFRFFHSWFMMDTFDDIIRHSWSSALEGKQFVYPNIAFECNNFIEVSSLLLQVAPFEN